jgi:hypothetical protein
MPKKSDDSGLIKRALTAARERVIFYDARRKRETIIGRGTKVENDANADAVALIDAALKALEQ